MSERKKGVGFYVGAKGIWAMLLSRLAMGVLKRLIENGKIDIAFDKGGEANEAVDP